MWQAISQQISDITGKQFVINEKEPVSGELNECYCISDGDTSRYFVKFNDRSMLSHFEAEAEATRQLSESDTVRAPAIVHVGTCKDHAFIVSQYVPMRTLDTESAFYLGQHLARLHQWGDQAEYGFDDDNYIGTNIQPNTWTRKWHRFFAEQRIGWQLQLASEKGYQLGNIDNIVEQVSKQLAHHQPRPSLLHGDLWIGNCALSVEGPVIFDPASYWGDRECDIAMTELFTGFPDSFLNGYNSVWALEDDYQNRKMLYNLYHLLNHLNLFGDSYLEQVRGAMLHCKLV